MSETESLDTLIPALIEKHGPRFMLKVAEETDDRIIDLQTSWPWCAYRMAEIQRIRRSGVRAAKSGATPRTRALLEYAAQHNAQYSVVRFTQATIGFPNNIPTMPPPVVYAQQVSARLAAQSTST